MRLLIVLLLLLCVGLLADARKMKSDQSYAKYEEYEDKSEYYEMKEFEPFLKAAQLNKVIEAAKAGHVVEPDADFLKVCAGWTAQEMCSTVFGSGIDEQTAWEEDLGYIPRAAADYSINYDEKSVTAWCLYLNPQQQTYKSIWRQGLGCTLVERYSEAEIRSTNTGNQEPPTPLDPNTPWPVGEGFFPELIPDEVDTDCLKEVADEQFANSLTNPRAIVVIYKNQLVYEQYAPKITKDNRLLGWSATKSLTQALIGILSGEGRIDISKPAEIPEWYVQAGDPRQNITVDMMLRMSSGTRWTGDLGPSTQCLFWSDCDCPYVCGLKPLVAEPDTLWNYNSGSSYLLSRLALESRGDAQYTNYEWPKRKLFYPIGAHSMYIEYQANGYYLGGSYGYGTARDWARFGLLFQRGGVWVDGNRILPAGWTEYSGRATHTSEDYAAHFWKLPLVDEALYFASGFRNQNVYIFPNHDLVVVRFAMPPLLAHPVYRPAPFLNGVLRCIQFNSTSTSPNQF